MNAEDEKKMNELYKRIDEIKAKLAKDGSSMPLTTHHMTVIHLVSCLLQYKALLEDLAYEHLQNTLQLEGELEKLKKVIEAMSN